MDICPDALYSHLRDDLNDCLGGDRIDKLLCSPTYQSFFSPQEAACYSIVRSFLKKLQVSNSSLLDSKALLKFLQVSYACSHWKMPVLSESDQILVGELRRAVYDFWNDEGYPLVVSDLSALNFGRVGPGASLGSRGGSLYHKLFASPLTCTNRHLYSSYTNYVHNFPEWSNAEIIRQTQYGEADVVEGNRLSFVPKDRTISRVICIEPSLNMFLQLGFGHVIEQRLSCLYGISMGTQPFKNRELARIGSWNGSLVTIDLSSASDSMSLNMLRSILPRDFMNLLMRYRSPKTYIPGIGYTEMGMVSTMGNGFTFPLQTMLFSCVVMAAFRKSGFQPRFPRGNDNGNWGVFGDDIIAPKEISDDVLRLLDILGFKINHDKTFLEGPFRESCGSDFFKGQNIRGIYIKNISTVQERFSAINLLNQFSTRTGVPLPRTVKALVHTVPWLPVPRWENDDSGIKIALSPIVRTLRVSKRYQSHLYTCYRAQGVRIRIGESALFAPKSSKRLIYNPSGLLISFLQRSVNACCIGIRHDPVVYKRKLGVAPYWDMAPTIHPLQGWFNWKRWETASYLNLFG